MLRICATTYRCVQPQAAPLPCFIPCVSRCLPLSLQAPTSVLSRSFKAGPSQVFCIRSSAQSGKHVQDFTIRSKIANQRMVSAISEHRIPVQLKPRPYKLSHAGGHPLNASQQNSGIICTGKASLHQLGQDIPLLIFAGDAQVLRVTDFDPPSLSNSTFSFGGRTMKFSHSSHSPGALPLRFFLG